MKLRTKVKLWYLKILRKRLYDEMLDSILNAKKPASIQEIDLMIELGLPLDKTRIILKGKTTEE